MLEFNQLIKSMEIKSPCCNYEMQLESDITTDFNKENQSITTNIRPLYKCLNCNNLYSAEITFFPLVKNIKIEFTTTIKP